MDYSVLYLLSMIINIVLDYILSYYTKEIIIKLELTLNITFITQ